MAGYGSLTFLDESEEKSTMSFYTGDVTAVSIAGLLAEWDDLRDSIAGLSKGTVQKEALKVFDTTLSNTPPVDPYAQREIKWLVQYEDSTQFFDDPVNAIPNEGYLRRYTLEIPVADLSGTRKLPGDDEADLTNAQWVAFIAAAEQTLRSPAGGRITILGAHLVGRAT